MQYIIAVLAALLIVSGIYSWRVGGKLEDCQKTGAVDAHEVHACGDTVGVLRQDVNDQNKAADRAAADAAEIDRIANERAKKLADDLLKKRRTEPVKNDQEMNQWYERLRSSLR